MTNKQHKEILTGISGKGNTEWLVVTVDDVTGQWIWVERFDNEPEAKAWFKYA